MIVLSLGGGIQSTALSLLADEGRFGGTKPDVAFFADTGNEPEYVYRTIDAIRERVGFPVEVVGTGRNIAEDVRLGLSSDGNPGFIGIPVHRKGGFSARQCTQQYKIRPIVKAIRKWLGIAYGKRVKAGTDVRQWIGISLDEIHRMSDNRLSYITNEYPLVDVRMTRQDCIRYLAEHHPDIPVGKSACIICPYHDAASWRRIATEQPDDFAYAVEVDRAMRNNPDLTKAGEIFLHSLKVPLDEAVKMHVNTPSLLDSLEGNECEGGCFL